MSSLVNHVSKNKVKLTWSSKLAQLQVSQLKIQFGRYLVPRLISFYQRPNISLKKESYQSFILQNSFFQWMRECTMKFSLNRISVQQKNWLTKKEKER